MSKPAQSKPVHVAEVASPIDGSRKYPKESFKKLREGARSKHGTLSSWKTEDDGLWPRTEYMFDGGTYELEEATNLWQPLSNHLKPALPFPFSVFDFAAFILHGDGYFFAMVNFDDKLDDGEFCDRLDADRLCEEREDGSTWANADAEIQLLKDAYLLRAMARDRFDLRKASASRDDIRAAASWLLEKNNPPHSTENVVVAVTTSDDANSAEVPVQRFEAQETALLAALVGSGVDPLALPKNPSGKPGVKAHTKVKLGKTGIWAGKTVFDKAWSRLTTEGRIAYRP